MKKIPLRAPRAPAAHENVFRLLHKSPKNDGFRCRKEAEQREASWGRHAKTDRQNYDVEAVFLQFRVGAERSEAPASTVSI